MLKEKEFEELLSQIAHELKTPLTSMIMGIDDLEDHFEQVSKGEEGYLESEAILDYIKRISRGIYSLESQMNNIMSSSIMYDADTLLLEPINISILVEEMLAQFKHYAFSSGVTLVGEIAPDILVSATREGLKTIIRNLMSNAIKFTAVSEKKTVQVKLTNQALLTIQDSGIGIDKEFLEKSLYSFKERGPNCKEYEISGYGVGLHTTRQIVERFSGTIQCQSELGVGTTFEVAFREKSLVRKTHTVLIVDDSATIRAAYKAVLGSRYNILEGANGREGLKVLQENKVDIIFTDLHMPELTGLEMAEEIRKLESGKKDVPIVLATTDGTSEIIQRSRELSLRGWLIKPFQPKMVQAIAENILSPKIEISKPEPEKEDPQIDLQEGLFSRMKKKVGWSA